MSFTKYPAFKHTQIINNQSVLGFTVLIHKLIRGEIKKDQEKFDCIAKLCNERKQKKHRNYVECFIYALMRKLKSQC